MANIKAKKKNIKRIAIQTERNRRVRSALKTLNKTLEKTADDADKKEVAKKYISALDKAVKHGIVHENNARRHKSKAARFLAA